MVEKIYLSLMVLSQTISYYLMMETGVIGGEIGLFKVELDQLLVAFIYIVNILLLFFIYGLYKYSVRIKRKRLKIFSISFNDKRLHFFLLIMLLGQIFFLYSTGVGRLLSDASSGYSFIFSMFSPGFLIFVYYLRCRENSNSIFWTNITLFCIFELSRGYTSFILLFVFIELYFYFKDVRISNIKGAIASILFSISILFLGSAAYQYIYPLKMEIRGMGSNHNPLNYEDALQKFSSRLTFLPVSIGGVQRGDDVERIFSDSSMNLKELVGVLRPISPSFLFDKTSFNSLNNDILKAYKPNTIINTSTDMGIFTYVYLLFKSDFMQGILYIVTLILLLFLLRRVIEILLSENGNFLLFLFVIKGVYYTANLEVVFSGFLGFLLFVLPLMYIFRVFKVYSQN